MIFIALVSFLFIDAADFPCSQLNLFDCNVGVGYCETDFGDDQIKCVAEPCFKLASSSAECASGCTFHSSSGGWCSNSGLELDSCTINAIRNGGECLSAEGCVSITVGEQKACMLDLDIYSCNSSAEDCHFLFVHGCTLKSGKCAFDRCNVFGEFPDSAPVTCDSWCTKTLTHEGGGEKEYKCVDSCNNGDECNKIFNEADGFKVSECISNDCPESDEFTYMNEPFGVCTSGEPYVPKPGCENGNPDNNGGNGTGDGAITVSKGLFGLALALVAVVLISFV